VREEKAAENLSSTPSLLKYLPNSEALQLAWRVLKNISNITAVTKVLRENLLRSDGESKREGGEKAALFFAGRAPN
jgi:hypothetical protein